MPDIQDIAIGALRVTNTDQPLSFGSIADCVAKPDPLILEIGANDGADTLRMVAAFRNAVIHCFEPDPRAAARFRQMVSHPRCILHQLAIAATDGELYLHMSGGQAGGLEDWDRSSSIRQPTGHLRVHPWCLFNRQCKVDARSLDSWTREYTQDQVIDFIWADVQGAEGDLIDGGAATLSTYVRYLYTEFYDLPMYDGQIGLAEILRRLPGFECIGIYEGYNALLRNALLG